MVSSDTHSLLSMSVGGRKHKENQDRAIARVIPWSPTPLYLLAVADGISSCRHGASVARYIIERHLQTDAIFDRGNLDVTNQLRDYLTALNRSFHEEFAEMEDMRDSGASLSVAVLGGWLADCLWAGDSPIYISRQRPNGYDTELILRPDVRNRALTDHFGGTAPFNLKHVRLTLQLGDILTITSDGAVHDADLLSDTYARCGFTPTVLREIRDLAYQSSTCDDVSVVSCQRKQG